MTDESVDVIPAAEMPEGPYFTGPAPVREDVAEGLPGARLAFTMKVVDAKTAAPLPDLRVEIWHSDAKGRYSGYDFNPDKHPESLEKPDTSNNDTFMRGAQVTDADGCVMFKTIYPGWYASRTPHIHVKLFRGETCILTTQLFMPDMVSKSVYEREEYARQTQQDSFNTNDLVIAIVPHDVGGCWLDLEAEGDGFVGEATIAVDPNATSVPIHAPPDWVPPVGGIEHGKPVR